MTSTPDRTLHCCYGTASETLDTLLTWAEVPTPELSWIEPMPSADAVAAGRPQTGMRWLTTGRPIPAKGVSVEEARLYWPSHWLHLAAGPMGVRWCLWSLVEPDTAGSIALAALRRVFAGSVYTLSVTADEETVLLRQDMKSRFLAETPKPDADTERREAPSGPPAFRYDRLVMTVYRDAGGRLITVRQALPKADPGPTPETAS